ncbi:hypothetical protein MKQ68_09280 [Chitinophaga horti]|uniref:Tetratricopeptide repeat protein n=1 Tax=Chitinophaga horti TaxID=2920382 RepID=A0ABY6J9P3_9BACT|nr:hypothetical protein [Chitinophaga horti]UYQ95287.1 hypothetical protein MKQ68_09280 [Chitinophaga horti]
MKYSALRYLGILLMVFFCACKSGEKMYNRGQYDDAVRLFVKKLQKRPNDSKSLALLPRAYQMAVETHEANVNSHLVSNNALKWERVRAEYNALQNLYYYIQSSPAALRIVKPKDYSSAITGAQENAAEARYNRGLQLMGENNKASARKAFHEFDATLALVPEYKDAKARREEAFNAGTIYVAISQLQMRSPSFQFSADQFRDVLLRDLQRRNLDRFVLFIDEREARAQKLRPDHYLELLFYDFVVGQTYVDRLEREVSREVVVGQTKERDSTGKVFNKDVWGIVKAKVFVTKKTVTSSGMMDYRITEVDNGRLLRTNRVPGQFVWLNQFGTFRGDERALSDEDRKLMTGRDMLPPPPQQLFTEMTRPIYDQMARELQSYYNSIY